MPGDSPPSSGLPPLRARQSSGMTPAIIRAPSSIGSKATRSSAGGAVRSRSQRPRFSRHYPGFRLRNCWLVLPARAILRRSRSSSLGMPRSGSTLVEQILASHPAVHAAGELTNLDVSSWAASDPAGRPVPFRLSRKSTPAAFERLGQAYLASLPTIAGGKTRITDKAPSNFFFAGLIHLILPNATIVHTVRDPVDTCVSCFSQLFTARPVVQLRPGRVGPLLPPIPRADGSIGDRFCRPAPCSTWLTRTWSTIWKGRPGG